MIPHHQVGLHVEFLGHPMRSPMGASVYLGLPSYRLAEKSGVPRGALQGSSVPAAGLRRPSRRLRAVPGTTSSGHRLAHRLG